MGFFFFSRGEFDGMSHKCQASLSSQFGLTAERFGNASGMSSRNLHSRHAKGRRCPPVSGDWSWASLRTATPACPRPKAGKGPIRNGWGLRLRCLKLENVGREAKSRQWGVGEVRSGSARAWGLSTRSRYRSPAVSTVQ